MIVRVKKMLRKIKNGIHKRGYLTDAKSVLIGAGLNYCLNVLRYVYYWFTGTKPPTRRK